MSKATAESALARKLSLYVSRHATSLVSDFDVLLHAMTPENIHNLRIKLRSIEANLFVMRRLFRKSWVDPLLAEVNDFDKTLGKSRDADIVAHELGDQLSRLNAVESTSALFLQAIAADRVVSAKSAMHLQISNHEFRARVQDFAGRLEHPQVRKSLAKADADQADALIAAEIDRAEKLLLKKVRGTAPKASPRRLHDVRIHAKRLRYATELTPVEAALPAWLVARKLQSILGDLQDLDVLRDWLDRVERRLDLPREERARRNIALRERDSKLRSRYRKQRRLLLGKTRVDAAASPISVDQPAPDQA